MRYPGVVGGHLGGPIQGTRRSIGPARSICTELGVPDDRFQGVRMTVSGVPDRWLGVVPGVVPTPVGSELHACRSSLTKVRVHRVRYTSSSGSYLKNITHVHRAKPPSDSVIRKELVPRTGLGRRGRLP